MTLRNRISIKTVAVFAILLFFMLSLSTGAMAANAKKLMFGDGSWDSLAVHNRIAAFIATHGMGYECDFVPSSTPIMVEAVKKGDLDVDMESWTENIQKIYDEGIADGTMLDLGPNFPDSWQGWLVPTYMIKGDAKRGIKATAPGLKSVSDLPKYWKLFRDPEDPSKGRFFNGIAGWAATAIGEKKFEAYGLGKNFNLVVSGSDAALSGSMVAAYERGKPWVGYYWGPTWVLGKMDMTPLQEPAFDKKVWEETKGCAFPSVQVNILINSKLPQKAPDFVEMLKKYETSMEICNKFLVYIKENKASSEEAAEWFLKTYEDVWTQWVTPEVAAKVKAAL